METAAGRGGLPAAEEGACEQALFGRDWFRGVGLPALEDGSGQETESGDRGSTEAVRRVGRLLEEAIGMGASDIHLEPGERELWVRVRLNGTLAEQVRLPLELHGRMVTHLKVRAGLDVTERRRPLDGRFDWSGGGERIDIRVSTVPGAHGEKVVLRILDPRRLPRDLSGLGADDYTERALQTSAERARGLVLVTGPTGSGKSTTLYTLLRSLDLGGRNVMTVEDPVEYRIEGITQVAVDSRIGRTFANVLRSFLRQDPDVLLVGEIRDLETAQICIRASLTGHLVLSTLHTNDAAGAVVRLVDMGIEPYLLADSLSLVCSQRLLRRLCAGCRRPAPEEAGVLERYGFRLQGRSGPFVAEGCERCRFTGVEGRVGIFETLLVDGEIERGIRQGLGAGEIRERAGARGLVTLVEQGLAQVEAARVSVREFTTQVLTANTLGGP